MMIEDAPLAAHVTMSEEVQAEAEMRMRDIGQRFGAIPEIKPMRINGTLLFANS
jgi:hypothetical protein